MFSRIYRTLALLCAVALVSLISGSAAAQGERVMSVARVSAPHSPGAVSRPRAQEERYPEIEQIAAQLWMIDRELISGFSGDLDAMERLARARRHREAGGSIDGYYLDRIRRDNPLYKAGIRNGDVVHTVNGDAVRSSFQVLRAFYRHRRAPVIRVELTRRGGRELTLVYLIS